MIPNYFPFTNLVWMPFLVLILAWSLVWKGMALWRAAQHKDKVWYVVLLLVNTVGVLEILYLYVFSRRKSLIQKIKEELK